MPVIPVLVGDAEMPVVSDLPDSLAPLLRRHAHVMSDRRWTHDLGELLAILRSIPAVPFRDRQQAVPAGRSGMAAWKKGLVAAVVLVVGLLAVVVATAPPETPAAAAASPVAGRADAPSAAAPAETSFDIAGGWRDEQDMAWHFQQTGEVLVVTAGSAVLPANLPPLAPQQKHEDSSYTNLRGEGTLVGREVTITLRDTETDRPSTWAAMVSPDGSIIEGTMQEDGDKEWLPFSLRRN